MTESQIRASFVNVSRRESAQATLPDLTSVDWDRLDYLGWRDSKRPLAYVILEINDSATGILLRASTPTTPSGARRRKAMCVWCEDIIETDDVSMYVARRAGAAGRRGDTIGTLICTEFNCSRNVRRTPTFEECGSDQPEDRQVIIERRIAGLRSRSTRFAAQVLNTDSRD